MKHVRVKCLPKDKTSTQYPSIQREETWYFAKNPTRSWVWNLGIYYYWSYGVLLRGKYELRSFTSVTELRYASTHSYVYKIKVSWNKLSHKLCLINYVCLKAVSLLQTCNYNTLTQCWANVGPVSPTVCQYYPSIGSASRACWVTKPEEWCLLNNVTTCELTIYVCASYRHLGVRRSYLQLYKVCKYDILTPRWRYVDIQERHHNNSHTCL